MQVIGTVEKDPWKSGLYFRGGDVIRPHGGQWFGPDYPKSYTHFFTRWRILPFLSIKIGKYGFYIGFKCFGVDRIEYANWFRFEHQWDIYPGSNALCPSMRFTNGN